MLLSMMASTGEMWGQTRGNSTATLTQSNLELTGGYTTNTEKTIGGITYVYTDLMKNNDNIQAKASSGTIKNTTAYPGDIVSVAITHSGTARATTINGSADGTNWTQVATGSGSITADFSNKGYKYFQITRGSNAAYWTQIVITYSDGGGSMLNSDLAITGSPVALSFDLYNNYDPQVVSYTTSSTGAITITPAESDYFTYEHNTGNKTITVTPTAVTPSAQTVTISQAADNTYNSGTATFTVSVTNSEPSSEHWVLTSLANLTPSDVFVIVGNKGSNYAMTNNNGTSSAPAIAAVTINNNEITSTIAANIQWNISGNATDGYTFYPNGSTTTWLYCNTTASSSSNNNIRVGTGDRKVFELNSSNYLVTKDTYTARYLSIYNNADWRGYINTDNCPILSFYKKITGNIPPTISADNENIAYNATSGSFTYAINNGVTGGELTAAVTDGNWLTLGEIGETTVSFSCSANGLAIDRSATVTLTYTYDAKEFVTKNVTITQAGDPTVFNNIEDIIAVGTTYKIRGTVVATSTKGFVVGDGTGYVYVYLNAAPTQAVGDMVTINGATGTYGQIIQFTSSATITEATESNYNGEPVFTVIDEVPDYSQGYHLSTYLQFEGTLTKDNNYYLVSVGSSQIRMSYPTDEQSSDLDELENKTVRVHGYYAGISTTGGSPVFTTMLESIEEVAVPTITITPSSINVNAEGGNETLSVACSNLSNNPGLEIQYFEANGTASATYNWIHANINLQGNIDVTIDANDSNERSAYLKVYGSTDDVYSNLVTLTQAAYVAPTYATLPFVFDGGISDIENTDGLYQDGLGDDYASSPKLKFNDSNDWLLLQFSEAPGTLTYDIKGNSFSGSTFKVQTSTNGTDFSDLETYTTLGDIQHESFNNINENVRYIKWIYTNKSNGNVALGNITLAKVDHTPSITLESNTIEAPFAGKDGTLTVTYQNITTVVADIYFCDAQGEAATYDWFDAEINNENNVDYLVGANNGAARTAYFKVWAYDDELQEVYSDIVTVSQAAFIQTTNYVAATSITSGMHYLVVGFNDAKVYAMGGQTSNNRSSVVVTNYYDYDNDVLSIPSSVAVYEFVINGPDASGYYTIYDKNQASTGFLYAASSSSNQLKTNEALDNNGKWTIEFDGEDVATIKAQGSNSRNWMRFNSGSSIFSCYGSGQSDIYLYVKDNDTDFEYYGSEITYTEPTIPAGETLTVGTGSVMNITNNSFTNNDPENIIIEDGGQVIVNNTGVQATFKKSVAHSGAKDAANWYTISSPVNNIAPGSVTNLIQATPANYDLYYYDEATTTWFNHKAAGHAVANMTNGKGYLYWNNTGAELSFPGELNSGSVVIAVTKTGTTDLSGFNLIGNPYSHNIYKGTGTAISNTNLSTGFYTLSNAGAWTAGTDNTTAIKPGQGILVKATAAGTVTMTNTTASGAKRGNEFIKFIIANSQYEDVVYALFENEEAGLNKINHRNANIPMLYIAQNEENYAIATMSDETQSFNLNLRAMTTGQYTLSFKAEGKYDYLHVIDRMTGEDIDMLLDGEYSFIASPSDNDARFIVKLGYNTNNSAENDIFAYQNGSDIVVNGEGELQVFDVTGRMVATQHVNGVQTVNVPSQGVFIFKLNEKTQKIVVR